MSGTWPYQPYLFTNWAEIYDRMKNTVWGNRSWQLCGKLVSSKCLASLLGIRPQRLKSAGMGRLDHRYRCFGAESRRTQDGAGVWVGVCVCWCLFCFLWAQRFWAQGKETQTIEVHAHRPILFETICASWWDVADTVPHLQTINQSIVAVRPAAIFRLFWSLINALLRFRRAARLRSQASDARPLLKVEFTPGKHHDDVDVGALFQRGGKQKDQPPEPSNLFWFLVVFSQEMTLLTTNRMQSRFCPENPSNPMWSWNYMWWAAKCFSHRHGLSVLQTVSRNWGTCCDQKRVMSTCASPGLWNATGAWILLTCPRDTSRLVIWGCCMCSVALMFRTWASSGCQLQISLLDSKLS